MTSCYWQNSTDIEHSHHHRTFPWTVLPFSHFSWLFFWIICMTLRVKLHDHLRQKTWLDVAAYSGPLPHDLRGIHIRVFFFCCLPCPLGYNSNSPSHSSVRQASPGSGFRYSFQLKEESRPLLNTSSTTPAHLLTFKQCAKGISQEGSRGGVGV